MIDFNFPVREKDRECYDCFGMCEMLFDAGLCYLDDNQDMEDMDDEDNENH